MKTKIIISLIALLFIAGDFLGGCEEEEPKPDYITVNVSASGYVAVQYEFGGQHYSVPGLTSGVNVKIEVEKADALKCDNMVTSDINSRFEWGTCTVKLYREQHVDVLFIGQGDIVDGQGNTYTGGFNSARLWWDDVYPITDFGETYNYAPQRNVVYTPKLN